jgi:putative hemolysin
MRTGGAVMPDAGGSGFSLAWAILAIALLALLWQWWTARRAGRSGRLPPRAPFWLGAVAWVLFGLLEQHPVEVGGMRLPLGWLLPAAGLLAAGMLRWSRVDLPSLMEHEAASAPADGLEDEEAEQRQQVEDAHLLRRLVSLRRRRAAELMVPLARAPVLRVQDSPEEVVACFGRTGGRYLPVLNEEGDAVLGVIDGRDWIAHAPAARGEGEPGRAGEPVPSIRALMRPVPVVSDRERAGTLLEILRRSGSGIAAIASDNGTLGGFVSWNQLFQALLGARAAGVAL